MATPASRAATSSVSRIRTTTASSSNQRSGTTRAKCRHCLRTGVHSGEFGQPRRSEEYVPVASPPDLAFVGRAADSLYFQISGSAPLRAGYGGDPSPPGFRYDLPSDHAVALPRVLAPPTAPQSYPGGLPAYPFFAHHEPGARLFPGSWFPVSVAVAGSLRAHCRFELALRWYKRSFDPLQRDCAWAHCDG